jgi:hypothetical protein
VSESAAMRLIAQQSGHCEIFPLRPAVTARDRKSRLATGITVCSAVYQISTNQMPTDLERFLEYPLWFKLVGVAGVLLVAFFLVGLAFVRPKKPRLDEAAAWSAYERFVIQQHARLASYSRGALLQITFLLHDGQLKVPRLQNNRELIERREATNAEYNQWIQANYKAEAEFDAAVVGLRAAFPISPEFNTLVDAASSTFRPKFLESVPIEGKDAQTWGDQISQNLNAELDLKVKKPLEALSAYLRKQIEDAKRG